MTSIEDLKRELNQLQEKKRQLQEKRDQKQKIKNLKRQIRAEKFAQTKSGKIFNKIADVGDAGFKATQKFLSEQPQQKGKKKRVDVNELIKRLPQ